MAHARIKSKDPEIVEQKLSQRWQMNKWEISRIETNLKALSPVTKASLACLRDRITEVWTQVEALKLEVLGATDFFNTIHETNFSECENAYLAIKQLLHEKYEPFETAPVLSTPCHHGSLPSIKVPKFDGNYKNWQKFRDLFTQLVINQAHLSDVQKLVHLMGSLEGEPLKLISVLTVCAESFTQAWKLLKERYDDKSKILDEHLQALFTFSPLKNGNASSLRDLHNVVTSHWLSIVAVPTKVPLAEIIVQFLVLSKLDSKTREAFLLSKGSTDIVPLQKVLDFISLRARALDIGPLSNDNMTSVPVSKTKRHVQPPPSKQVFQLEASSAASGQQSCVVCSSGQHPVYSCTRFQNMNVQQRWNVVASNQLCSNCLWRKVPSHRCSTYKCKTCGKNHHTLLHKPQSQRSGTYNATTSNSQLPLKDNSSHPTQSPTTQVTSHTPQPSNTNTHALTHVVFNNLNHVGNLLPTAIVNASNELGQSLPARVLLDSGSEVSLITESLVQALRLKRVRHKATIHSVNALTSGSNASVQVIISSRCCKWQQNIECLVVPSIVKATPQRSIDLGALKLPAGLKLADEKFFLPRKLDILFNSSLFFQVLNNKKTCAGARALIINTKLGNVVTGDHLPTVKQSSEPPAQCFLVTAQFPSEINDLKHIWCGENISPSCDENFSTLTHPCEQHFKNETFRLENGQFCVSLPFKRSPNVLGNSYHVAKQFLLAMESRFAKNRELQSNYVSFMREYIELGHAVESTAKVAPPSYFIPHFYVLNPHSKSTPLRAVFHCSAKSSSGHSLNDLLWAGPTVQPELFDILLRFRSFNVCFTADIEKMYRMVRVNEHDTKFQRILWRETPTEPIKVYTLKTVTYGMAPSAFLSTRCLNQLANEVAKEDPEVALAIKHAFYVDDLLYGGHSVEHAAALFKRIAMLLKSAHFNLRKMNSNSTSLIDTLHRTQTDSPPASTPLTSDTFHRILGLTWHPRNDTLCIAFNKDSNREALYCSSLTKRIVLHLIASIYDPLGLLNPFLVKLKLFLQKLWFLGLEWDAPLSQELAFHWELLLKEIVAVSTIVFPRRVLNPASSFVCLVGFCDASQKAYGAAIYIVSFTSVAVADSHLLCSKSKLAPLTGSTIPRLELCAALLLAKLAVKVKRALEIVCPVNQVCLFSDSSVVLHWLVKDEHKLDSFIINRISKIRACFPIALWCHVSSTQNPADLLTRGISPLMLQRSSLWFKGPPWLQEPLSQWPKSFVHIDVAEDGNVDPHCCFSTTAQSAHSLVNTDEPQNPLIKYVLSRYSKYYQLIRVTALCLRFICNVRVRIAARVNPPPAPCRKSGGISPLEIQEATAVLVKLIQHDRYPLEYKALSQKGTLPVRSPLLSLNPFLGPDGLLRVGGRLMNTHVLNVNKHPIILPPDHRFTMLFLEMIHVRFLHAGPSLMLGHARQQFWIPSLRRMAKKIINACVTCMRWKATPVGQIMGSLPSTRVNPSRPWAYTSLDYCGPILTKPSLTRTKVNQKSWIAVFVCHSTKAVHLEIVENLSTSQFIAAFERFGSRRGYPVQMYSDNASTFKKASRIIEEANRFIFSPQNLEAVMRFLSVQGTNWNFCPTYSPHRNALAEACVKSLKFHLRRALGQQILPLLTLYTLLVKIEACLNSRPLELISSAAGDNIILTPNHLVHGDALNNFPLDTKDPSKDTSLIHRYVALNNKLAVIWKYWTRNYLHTLQQRVKWKKVLPPLQQKDLVVLIEDSPPSCWKLGIVEKLIPDKRGIVRTAVIRTSHGSILRPVQKLCVLSRHGGTTTSTTTV